MMSINEMIINALEPIGYPVVPNIYEGKEDHYFTFNCADDRGNMFTDNKPSEALMSMQIHLFIPRGENYLAVKKRARNLIFEAGFTFPEITEVTEEKLRHIIFECEIGEKL